MHKFTGGDADAELTALANYTSRQFGLHPPASRQINPQATPAGGVKAGVAKRIAPQLADPPRESRVAYVRSVSRNTGVERDNSTRRSH
jgi:hypothetical protein